jgi:uncharacterized Zn finger protein
MSYYYGWRPYVSVAERRRKAEREMQKLRKKGHPVSPVTIAGRTIASTFWGRAWCDNLEGYSDFENRLPRGRTYVRNGSVVDLQIAPGEVTALVSGSEIYRVAVQVSAVPPEAWGSICTDCAGAIDSLVELLQGRFSDGVMERLCRQETGLFPTPAEIRFSCSCPDWASMCKHVAAVLYGIGARLDRQPELLFQLRRVDEQDLIAKAGAGLPLAKTGPAGDKILAADGLSELFGVELGAGEEAVAPESAPSAEPEKPGKTRRTAKAKPAAIVAPPPAAPVKTRRSAKKMTMPEIEVLAEPLPRVTRRTSSTTKKQSRKPKPKRTPKRKSKKD